MKIPTPLETPLATLSQPAFSPFTPDSLYVAPYTERTAAGAYELPKLAAAVGCIRLARPNLLPCAGENKDPRTVPKDAPDKDMTGAGNDAPTNPDDGRRSDRDSQQRQKN